MKDYYHILGLTSTCQQAEIKKAYRVLAVQYHPDKNNGDRASEERFKEISVAYSTLIDEALRNEYDYIRGYKTTYRNLRTEPGAPSPVSYLTRVQRIKTQVLNAGGRINKTALFTVLNGLLNEKTITYLILQRDILTNNLITDEVFTCCVFLDEAAKATLYSSLEKLANGDPKFAEKLALRNKRDSTAQNFTISKPAESTDERPATTTILIFILFIVLFVILLAL
ncbi:J domain-containing protein [Flavobacterium sp. RHBU_24]|uniref:J domain-containing protein n=1 Tax=Flavobacterium sp. RHBU_24 TaxID=3391185 RepID=UPI003985320A